MGHHVVSETIGDETIILDMRAGAFYATTGQGSLVWQALEAGHARAAIEHRLARAWGDGPELDSVVTLLDDLEARGLVVVPDGVADALSHPALDALAARPERVSLEVHDDLSDLLLLDPVHDVAAQGWPTPAPE